MDWKLSVDYSDLIEELEADILEFGWNNEDVLFIVRDAEIVHTHLILKTTKAYAPIIDYFYGYPEPEERVFKTTVGQVIKEMNYMNDVM